MKMSGLKANVTVDCDTDTLKRLAKIAKTATWLADQIAELRLAVEIKTQVASSDTQPQQPSA